MDTVWIIVAAAIGLVLLTALAAYLLWRFRRLDEKTLAKRIAKLPFSDKLALGGSLFRDHRIPLAPRMTALGLVLYLAMPLDIIPDFIPVLGYLDDVLIVVIGAGVLLRSVPRHVIEEHVIRYEAKARDAKMLESAHR